jgi:NAD(P)-dependent dehydrogenase (short-subunit alcohol dehydrogenase family)
MPDGKLSQKTAVVTGGGSGIGQAIAIRFAREGAHVSIIELSTEKAAETQKKISSTDGQVTVYVCDVADHKSVHKTFAAIAEKLQEIDILVNNAGIAHIGSLDKTTEAALDRIYSVNIKGVYNCMHAAIGQMQEQGGGVILNMASIASKIGIADRFAYSMSKGAVLTMTLSVAKDYVAENIRCNCICPARIHTPFVDNYVKKNYPEQVDTIMRQLSEYQPVGRMGKPEEVADLALFLCSDEAAFITGSAYDIDGGATYLR